MDTDQDFYRGDPADIVIGRVEKPARRHRKPGPKPKLSAEKHITLMIVERMEELAPLVAEYNKLGNAYQVLKDV